MSKDNVSKEEVKSPKVATAPQDKPGPKMVPVTKPGDGGNSPAGPPQQGEVPVVAAPAPAERRKLVIESDGNKLYFVLNQFNVFECHDAARQLATADVKVQ